MIPFLLSLLLTFAQAPEGTPPKEHEDPPVEQMTPVDPNDGTPMQEANEGEAESLEPDESASQQPDQPPVAVPGATKPTATPEQVGAAAPLDMGMWLVNLARHQGHLVGRTDPRRASLHVIALLEAAKEVAPECAETYQWLYDLYLRMGRSADARQALEKYIGLSPNDAGARLQLLTLELDSRQTAEKRLEYVEGEIKKPALPPVYESQLRYWAAKYAFERGERGPAGNQVEQALRLNPMNVAARQLAYEMFGETEAAVQRVEMALQLIAINPSQVNLVWELAEFLDRLSLHRQAQEWYNRALDLHRRAEAGPIPADLWQKLAISYICSEDYAKAKEAAAEALKADPKLQEARLLLSNAEAKLGNDTAAAADQDAVQKEYDARIAEVIEKNLTEEAAPIAWFYAYHRPDKEKALKVATVAMQAESPPTLAKLAYGYALNANGKTDEAIDVLQPLAEVDQLAALELARAFLQRGQKAEAIKLLHKAASIQTSGIAYNLIRDLLLKYNEKVAGPAQNSKIVAALEKFPRDVFDYYRRTSDFLHFTMRFASDRILVGGPIDVVLRLENAGPFTITFGEGMMARPLVAISAKVGGENPVTFENYLQVMMSARPVLVPGDAFERTVAIDVGPIREKLIAGSVHEMGVEISAMLDPVYQEGKLVSGLGTVVASPISVTRKAIPTDESSLASLVAGGAADAFSRIDRAEKIGVLLAIAQVDKTLADKLPTHDLRTALAKLIADSDWRVRARAICAANWLKIDSEVLMPAAAAGVGDTQVAVRLMAVRLFAAQQGQPFFKALEHLREADPSTSVRTLAASFLPEQPGPQASRSPSTEN